MTAEWAESRIKDLREDAAAMKTYGQQFELEDAIDRLLEHVRGAIKSELNERRHLERWVARAIRRNYDSPNSYAREALQRLAVRLEALRRIRKELIEGRRALAAEWKDQVAVANALQADLAAERARR